MHGKRTKIDAKCFSLTKLDSCKFSYFCYRGQDNADFLTFTDYVGMDTDILITFWPARIK